MILPDNDEAGEAHAEKVRASLTENPCAVLRLNGLPNKGDVSDWLNAGGTRDELVALAEAALAAPADPFVELADDPADPKDLPDLVLDPKGRWPVWCPENCGVVLERHHAWRGLLAYDGFRAVTVLQRPIPGSHAPRFNFQPRELRDADFTAAHRWFSRHFHPNATRAITIDVMLQVARENTFEPVQDYLRSLVWDGTPRLGSWLSTYLGAPQTAYVAAVGKAWLVSAVARSLAPGCKADCALILEGEQGALKSTALRTLAGDDWFSDSLPGFAGKDASSNLRGKWIVELAELAAMRRSDIETIKSFMSRQVESYRPAFGRAEVFEPRRCVFAGSTNAAKYLRDPTGNRRFWPVPVTTIDIPALAEDRDQLWAEAVVAYDDGDPWWLPHEMGQIAAQETAQRTEEDPWVATIADYLAGRAETSTRECLSAVGVLISDQNKAMAMRVGDILLSLGWRRQGRFDGGPNRKLTRYVPEDSPR
ncbi:MAG: virulence-associated E family protein [Kiritimatiellia bacterium]